MGGIGKTVLASAVVRDNEVRRFFSDGIYWLTLGQHANAVAQQIRLAHEISRQPESFLDVQVGKARLEELLRTKRSLIVLDDVWSIEDARAFDLKDCTARLLLTTRDERVIEVVNAAEIKVSKLSADLGLDMLAAFSGQSRDTLPVEAVSLIDRVSGLPLALAMAGRLAQGKPKAWASVFQRVENDRLAAPIGKEEEFPYASVASAIDASVEALSPEIREFFLDLSVFPEDERIPVSVLEIFWARRGVDALGVTEYADDFVARALAGWDEEHDGEALKDRLVLHDLVAGYLRHRVIDRAARHNRLIDAYRPASGKWADLRVDQPYIWNWLSYHLVEAGCSEELKALLLDPAWIAAKLATTNVQGLLADYDRVPKDNDLELVRQALTMSAHILVRDKTQLAGQLTGRLLESTRPPLKNLLAQIRGSTSGYWLCPETASLAIAGSALLRTFEGHQGGLRAAAVLPDGRRALSSADDGTLKLWDLQRGELLRTFEGHQGWLSAVAVLPDGRRALSGADDGTLKLWDLERGELLRTFEGHQGGVRAVAVPPDGRRALSGADDGMLKLWDLQRGELLRTFEGHQGGVRAVAVLPDGQRALSGGEDHTLKLWDLQRGELLRTFEGHAGGVSAVTVLPDGQRALSGAGDRTLKLWDLERGELLRTFEGHQGWIMAVAVLPDRRQALSGGNDGTLKLWDLETATPLAIFTADAALLTVGVVAGDLFVAGSVDGNVHTLRLLT